MKRMIHAGVCAALGAVLALGLTGCGAAPGATTPQTAQDPASVTVSASGTVQLTPDKATVSFGVTTQEKSAELAQSRNSEAVQKVVDALIAQGVAEASIRTEYYNLYPRYDWSADGEQRLIGYEVSTTMCVQDQEIEELGKLLSVCVDAGVTNINNVSFLCSGYDEAYQQALAQAVEAARTKAEVLARAAGKKLGDPIVISEGWQDTSARYSRSANMLADFAVKESAEAAPVLQPGETEITANVTVSYALR